MFLQTYYFTQIETFKVLDKANFFFHSLTFHLASKTHILLERNDCVSKLNTLKLK